MVQPGFIYVGGSNPLIQVGSATVLTTADNVLTTASTIDPSQMGTYSSSNQITCASFAQLKFHSNYSGNDVTLKQILDACGL